MGDDFEAGVVLGAIGMLTVIGLLCVVNGCERSGSYRRGVIDATRGAATVERIENDRGELVWGEVVKVEPKEGN